MGRRGHRGRSEINRTRHPAARRELAEVLYFAVDPQRQRARAIDVSVDDRHPVFGQIAGQLELNARVVDRDVCRQDQRVAVALLPEAMDDRRHQPQHAAGTLKFDQGRPVAIEPVENLGMDRIGRFEPDLVIRITTLRRKLLLLGPVEVGEGPRSHIAVPELCRIGHRLEQPPPHDLKALFGTCRSP